MKTDLLKLVLSDSKGFRNVYCDQHLSPWFERCGDKKSLILSVNRLVTLSCCALPGFSRQFNPSDLLWTVEMITNAKKAKTDSIMNRCLFSYLQKYLKKKKININVIRWFHKFFVTTNLGMFRKTEFVYVLCAVFLSVNP